MTETKWSKIKDPQAVLDYKWNWGSKYLGDDTITDAEFDVYDTSGQPIGSGDTGAVAVDDLSFDDTSATAWLSGGTVNVQNIVTCHITTAAGRQDDRSLYLSIKQR